MFLESILLSYNILVYAVPFSTLHTTMAIRNVGHFEALIYQVTKSFIKSYVVQI